jgi:alcohol dehydrogenase class IV
LAKAIALETGVPILAIPTTYAGSEMTPIWGITANGRKTTGSDPRVLPRTVVYDPELVLSLPPRVGAASGMNAMAHCVEALYAHDGNPIVSLMAEEGIRALAAALPRLKERAEDPAARADALYGAWLSGTVLAGTSMALHHKLCHVLGGSFDLPHAETHAVVLPYALAFNAPAVPEAVARIARAIGIADVADAAGRLHDIAGASGAPVSLAALGMPEAGIDKAAELAVADPYWNPRPFDRAAIRALLDDAWHGRRPTIG